MEQLLFQRPNKLMPSPALAALLEVPTGLLGFGADGVNGCPFWDGFYSLTVSSCPWDAWCLCTPNKQSHIYLHTRGSSQRLLHLTAVPQPASAYPLCSTGTLWVRAEIRGLVSVSDGWECLQGREKSLCNCSWNGAHVEGVELELRGAGDEVLFYRPDFIRRTSGVKLNSETPDSRTGGFLKRRLFPGTGEHPVSKWQLSQWSLSSMMATSPARRERINWKVFSSLCWEGPNSRKPLIYIHNCCIFYKYM